jgi:hypothetical protein
MNKNKPNYFVITVASAAVIIIILLLFIFKLCEEKPVSLIEYSETDIYLEMDMTKTLEPVIIPYSATEDDLIYEFSSDIIAIKNFVITPKDYGTVKFYATNKDGTKKSNMVTVNVVKSISDLIPEDIELQENVRFNTTDNDYVYYSGSGTKFHTKNCSYLKETAYRITYKEAEMRELTPCKMCNP